MATAGLGLYVDSPSASNGTAGEGGSYFQSILTNPPPLEAFDAFKKTNATYKERTTSGALVTLLVSLMIASLVFHEAREYLYGDPDYTFSVDRGVSHQLQINFDATVAMPCQFLTVDVRDAVGDRLHVSDQFKKDSTTFELGQAQRLKSGVIALDELLPLTQQDYRSLKNSKQYSASRMVSDSRKSRKGKFKKTEHVVENGNACRVYGSMDVKKVTGNLHITTLGHGYLSWEHTDHALMNLSHIIHEFSFGPFFPSIVQPLDNTFETTDAHFHIFQYFLSVVSTTYIDAGRRKLHTNQYSVTDMSRTTEHGKGVPGIFFKYDIEPMSLTITERTTTLFQFLVRLAGIVGGILVCTDYGYRTASFLWSNYAKTGSRADININTPIPTSFKSPSVSSAFSNQANANARSFALSSAFDAHPASSSSYTPGTPLPGGGAANGHVAQSPSVYATPNLLQTPRPNAQLGAHQHHNHGRSPSLSPYVPFQTPQTQSVPSMSMQPSYSSQGAEAAAAAGAAGSVDLTGTGSRARVRSASTASKS